MSEARPGSRTLESLFAVDLRTLAALRIGLALLLLVDLALRLPLAATFLTADGVRPGHPSGAWGLYQLSDSVGVQQALFALAAAAAACLLVGLWTRAAGVATAVLLLSLHARSPWILDAGDHVLGLLAIWTVLLPCGERWSLDARRAPPTARAGRVLSPASAGLRLQVAFVYVFSALHKLRGVSWRSGHAVQDALGQSLWARDLGRWIVAHPSVASSLTYATLAIELAAPLLLFLPWRTRRARAVAVASLLLLQVGLGLSLRLGLFPWAMTLALVPFVPGSFWDRWARAPEAAAVRREAKPAVRWAGAALLGVVLLSNAKSVSARPWPALVETLERTTGVRQSWSMYAPNPYALDFGMEVEAELSDGARVTLDDGRGGRRWSGLRALWDDYRGGMYMENLADARWPAEHEAFARWVRREWERGDPAGRAIVGLRLTLHEWPPGHPREDRVTPLYAWPD